jgi:hypothetical protein
MVYLGDLSAMTLVFTIRYPVDESVTLKNLIVIKLNGNTDMF